MKLTLEQKNWIQSYELAKTNKGTYDNDIGFTPLDEIAIPEWYEDYLYELENEKQPPSIEKINSVQMNNSMKEFLRAGSGKATEQSAGVTVTTGAPASAVNEGSTPSQSTDWKREFIEAGRRGGNVTKLRGSEYYSKIAKLSWEKRRQ